MNLLSPTEVVAINERHTDAGLNDYAALSKALEEPTSMVFGRPVALTIHHYSAAIVRGLLVNRPFAEGNRRTAVDAAAELYWINEHWWQPPERLIVYVHQLAECSLVDIAAWFSEWTAPSPAHLTASPQAASALARSYFMAPPAQRA